MTEKPQKKSDLLSGLVEKKAQERWGEKKEENYNKYKDSETYRTIIIHCYKLLLYLLSVVVVRMHSRLVVVSLNSALCTNPVGSTFIYFISGLHVQTILSMKVCVWSNILPRLYITTCKLLGLYNHTCCASSFNVNIEFPNGCMYITSTLIKGSRTLGVYNNSVNDNRASLNIYQY